MASGGIPVEIDEDDELFEIDLDAVNCIFPPPHFSDDDTNSFFTATGGAALLANCLLPICDLSNAVPMVDSGEDEMEPTRLEKNFLLPPDLGRNQALIDRLEMKISNG